MGVLHSMVTLFGQQHQLLQEVVTGRRPRDNESLDSSLTQRQRMSAPGTQQVVGKFLHYVLAVHDVGHNGRMHTYLLTQISTPRAC